MNFNFNVQSLLPNEINDVDEVLNSIKKLEKSKQDEEKLALIVNELGKNSALAQNLPHSITTLQGARLYNHRIYILKGRDQERNFNLVLGFIKVGQKKLFLLDHRGNHNELNPLCVLDFYIHEKFQRRGLGLQLFNHMLNKENIKVEYLAIDRPSSKFTSFLKKHFRLYSTIPQVNNFVIFDGFFKGQNLSGKRNTINNHNKNKLQYNNKWQQVSQRHSQLYGINPIFNNSFNHVTSRTRKRWDDAETFGNKSHEEVSRSIYSRYNYSKPNKLNGVQDATYSEKTLDDTIENHKNHTEKFDFQSPTPNNVHDNFKFSTSSKPNNTKPVIQNTDTVTSVSTHTTHPIKTLPTNQHDRYKTSHSSMIEELKAKDLSQQKVANLNFRWHHNSNSGWNIFGIHTAPSSS